MSNINARSIKEIVDKIYRSARTEHASNVDPNSIKKLIEDIGHWRKDLQADAIVKLVRIGGHAVPDLANALRDTTNEERRRNAALALAKIKDPSAFDTLVRALENPQSFVRSEAASALGVRKDRRAVEPLLHRLGDPDKKVAESASEALAQIGSPAIPFLMSKLQDKPEIDYRLYVIESLVRMEDSRAMDVLVAMLKDPSPQLRAQGAAALGRTKNQRAVKSLVKTLDDPVVEVFQSAADALGEIGTPASVNGLHSKLDSRPGDVSLCMAIARTGALGLRPFSAKLRSRNQRTRYIAAQELTLIAASGLITADESTSAIIPALSRALKDESAEVRRASIWALHIIAIKAWGNRYR